MSYLFIKICLKEKSLYYFHKLKILKNPKKQKKTFLVGFFRWFFEVFWVGFFGWVFYCQPCLHEEGGPARGQHVPSPVVQLAPLIVAHQDIPDGHKKVYFGKVLQMCAKIIAEHINK
jgi:hypothetical protein